MPPGRNDPCPCGSGRKYKKCHGDPVTLAAAKTVALSPSEIIAGKRDRLMVAIVRFATRHGGEDWIPYAFATYVDEWYDQLPRDEVQTALPWALFHFPEEATGLSMAELYRDSGMRRLEEDLPALLDAEIAAHYSIWEVIATTPGVGLQMKDRLTGLERFVSDTSTSHDVVPLDTMLARIVDYDGVSTFSGIFPSPLPPFAADAVVTEMKRVFRVRTRPVSLEKLRDPEHQLGLLDVWRSMFDDEDTEALPSVVTAEGDALTFVTDRYDFDTKNTARIIDGLMSIPGADAPPGEEVRSIVLVRQDGVGRTSSRPSVLAVIEFVKSRLEVSTMSIERANASRTLIESALGPLVRYRIREEATAAAAMNPEITPPRPSLAQDKAPSVDELEMMRQFREQYMLDWLDMPIPALGDRTPREAAADKKQHKALDLLLREIENRENRLPIAERSDIHQIRRTLGM